MTRSTRRHSLSVPGSVPPEAVIPLDFTLAKAVDLTPHRCLVCGRLREYACEATGLRRLRVLCSPRCWRAFRDPRRDDWEYLEAELSCCLVCSGPSQPLLEPLPSPTADVPREGLRARLGY